MTVVTDGEGVALTPLDPTTPPMPTGPGVTKVGQLENDRGYLTATALDGLATQQQVADATADMMRKEDARGLATESDGAKARSALQPGALADYVTMQDLAEGLASVATAEQGQLADTAVQPEALSNRLGDYATKQALSEAIATRATREQGDKADSALQRADLEPYARSADLGGYVTSAALADSLSGLARSMDLQGYVTATALSASLAGYATRAQGDKADSALQPKDLADYATTSSVTQAVNGRATAAQGLLAASAMQPPGIPVAKALSFATAYRADNLSKSAFLSIMLRLSYTVTVAGLMADEIELRIGPAADVATGGGYRVATAEGGVTGIALIIGTTVVTRPQLFATIPPGWYFAVRRLAGTGATIHSAFVQPLG